MALFVAGTGPFSPFGFAHVDLKKNCLHFICNGVCWLTVKLRDLFVYVITYLGTKVTSSMLLVSMFNPLETI